MSRASILELIYPSGAVPLKELEHYNREVEPALEGLLRAIGDPDAKPHLTSDDITARIVEEVQKRGPRFAEIGRDLTAEGIPLSRNATKKRYENWRNKQAVTTAAARQRTAAVESKGTKEGAGTIRTSPKKDSDETLRNAADSQPTLPKAEGGSAGASLQEAKSETAESSQDLIQKSPRKSTRVPKIPHSEDEFILYERAKGRTFKEIRGELQAKGIECTEADVYARHSSEKRKREKAARGKLPHNTLTTKEVAREMPRDSGSQTQQNANPPGSEMTGYQTSSLQASQQDGKPTAVEKLEPKSISRRELDEMIWRMWKNEGLDTDKISDKLCAQGYFYGSGTVRTRLLAQGAKL